MEYKILETGTVENITIKTTTSGYKTLETGKQIKT